MRVMLFGHPRSASTYLQEVIAYLYRIGLTGEPFNDKIDNPKQYILDHDNFVTKLTTPVFNRYKYEDFDWTIFDQVVVTDRQNFALACASVYHAQQIGTYQFKDKSHLQNLDYFNIPKEFIKGFINDYNVFLDILGKLKHNNIKFELFYYEDINKDINSIINKFPNKFYDNLDNFKSTFVSTDIDYKQLCTNYEELETAFADLYKLRDERI
jgi:hypothetical protein